MDSVSVVNRNGGVIRSSSTSAKPIRRRRVPSRWGYVAPTERDTAAGLGWQAGHLGAGNLGASLEGERYATPR